MALSIIALVLSVLALAAVGFIVYLLRSKAKDAVMEVVEAALKKADPATFDEFQKYLDKYYTPDSGLKANYVRKDELTTAVTEAVNAAVTAADLATKTEVTNAVTNAAPPDLSPLETRLTALETAPAPALPPAPTGNFATVSEVRSVERKLAALSNGGGSGNSKAVTDAVKALAALVVGPAKDPITEEIKALEAEISDARKHIAPFEKAVTDAKKKVADAKRALLPESISEEAMEREASAYVKGLGLKTARERADARADYEDNIRPQKVEEAKATHQSAQEALMEAETQLDGAKADYNTAEAQAKLAELRKQLSAFDAVETALAALDTSPAPAPKAAPAPRPAAPPRPSKAPPPAESPMEVRDEELEDRGAPDSVPDLGALVQLASSPPPAGRLPAPPPLPADKHCTSCGSGATKAMKFCGKCGTALPSA